MAILSIADLILKYPEIGESNWYKWIKENKLKKYNTSVINPSNHTEQAAYGLDSDEIKKKLKSGEINSFKSNGARTKQREKLTETILNIVKKATLTGDNGYDEYWPGFEAIRDEIFDATNVRPPLNHVKIALKILRLKGLVKMKPCHNEDGKLTGTGYFFVKGA